ncbi:protein kinase domain-containing protein [Arsenicicoccus sp. oral taxon 190]|uniref:protein kinase domain-containing protein n=1 Tax=Arsenicicoccus sp. oral taxon 190 TaxID=1658671 RepID=UPI00155DB243|nr:protein kinase [Arsenicicoccus sp. oral taxon 190]
MSGDTVLAGRYRLDRQIGRGGMGQVWSAIDTRLQRQVAVKTVDLASSGDEIAAQRFQQEAHATAALSHPNIVTIFDNGVDGSTAYLVMELLSGPSLEELVRAEGPLPVDRALDYAQAVASALGAAHRAGVVHRDVKPSNLMLDQRGTLKMVDFGIARLDQARTSQLTATATVIGSAPYLSPEQATGSTATPQSDLYSLGCVLMTLLTGEPPFEGEHPLSVLHHHLSTPAPRPSDRRPGIPPAVDALVAQLLAKRPEDRPASASDVAGRIAAIRRGAAPETTVLPAAGAAAATTVLPPVPAREEPRTRTSSAPVAAYADPPARAPRRRGTGALWFLVLLLAATVAAMWWFVLGPGRSTSPTPTPTGTTRTVTATATTTPTPSSSRPSTSVASTPPTSAPTTPPTTSITPAPTTTAPATTATTPPPATTAPTASATPTPSWPGASSAAQALQSTVDGAGLPKDAAKEASASLRDVRKAIDKQDGSGAQAALGQLTGVIDGQGDALSPETRQAIAAATEQVQGQLPAA